MATPPHTRPSKDKDAAAVLKRMADCPAYFSNALSSIRFFRTSRIHFSRRSVCREHHRANAKTCLLERWQGEAVVRTWSIQFLRLDRADFYRLSFRAVHATAGGSFRGTIREKFVHMQKNVLSLSQIGAMFSLEAQESPGASQRKERKAERKKHECRR
jgi:hypothetical protein